MGIWKSEDVLQNMFDTKNPTTRYRYKCNSVIVTGNKIIIPLFNYESVGRKNQFSKNNLVFSWDENAQWFGVAHES